MTLKSFLAGLAALAAGGAFGTEFTVGRTTAVADGAIGKGEYTAAFSLQYRTNNRNLKENALAPLQAETSFAWDERNLYVALRSDAETMRTKVRERDGALWEDDSVEVYVAADDLEADVYQFIFNARGDIYDAKSSSAKWNSEGVVSKSGVKDGVWEFEAAIPWKTLGLTAANGMKCRVNVARTYYGGGKNRIGAGEERWAHMGLKFSTALTRERNWSAKEFFPRMTLSADAPRWRAEAPKIPEGRGAGEIPVEVKAADGRTMLSAIAVYANPPPLKFRGVSTDVANEVLKFSSENWLSNDGDAEIAFDFRDFADESRSVWTRKIPAIGAHGRVDQLLDVKGLPPGLYKVHYVVTESSSSAKRRDAASPEAGADHASSRDADGGSGVSPLRLVDDFFYYAKPKDGKAPWDGFADGREDRVLSPWTAPDFDADGFSCWNRTVKFETASGKVGLVRSIVSAGKEILSAPVMIDLDFKPVEFRCARVDEHRSFADYRFTAVGQPIVVDLRCEFDGLMWFKMRYGGKDVRVQDLKLRIPLRPEIVKAWDDCQSVYDKVRIRDGEIGTWKANVVHAPFFWVGGEVGLMGGRPGLKGWHCADKGSGETFVKTSDSATVTLHFVDRPFTMDAAREIEFYLEPTPVRRRVSFRSVALPEKIVTWTGHTSRFFESKIPGMNDTVTPADDWRRFDRYRRREGRRITWYYATKGASPVFPWWGWYGADWNLSGDPGTSVMEIPKSDRVLADHSRWAWTCCRSRSYFDYKLWSIAWFVDHPDYGVNDLYFDLSWPRNCANADHGCKWKDEFGCTCYENDVREVREFQKRVAAIVQRKNPNGVVRGHLTNTRTPADVFFDVLTMGEAYERRVSDKHSYYDILTPADMEVTYGMRANESEIDFMCQIYRTIQVYKPSLLKEFDPDKPTFDRAIRHFGAYQSVFDLVYQSNSTVDPTDKGGWQLRKLHLYKLGLGSDRRTSAYWQEGCPVTVDTPEERFIYAVTSGREKAMLVLLNDTDREVTKNVSLDLKPYFVKNPVGKDLYGHGEYSLKSGSFTVTLPPRESRFIVFE